MTASMQPIKFTLNDGVLQASGNKRRKGKLARNRALVR
jgi:hypothetical protein